MQKITPFLWFNDNAEDAINFYTSIFKNSRVINLSRYGEGAPVPSGTLMSGTFQIEGQEFMGLNGGPKFKFTEATSFFISCETQDEVDYYWNALTAHGGEESQCAWLKDKFGVSWQVVPSALMRLMSDPDRAKAERVMQAMLKMRKIIIADLEKAAAS